MSRDSLPEFNWCDLYAQVAWGLNDPEWAECSKKVKNRRKPLRMAEARAEVAKYEHRHNLPSGSLLGGESAGAAPSALSAGGQPAGLVVDAALVPPPFPAATPHKEMPAPPPPVCPPPDAGKTPAGKTYLV